jgi:serine/threonine protein kinase
MKKTLKFRTRTKAVTLTDDNYKASGGFGSVFCLNDIAYKIYHDPKNMIPEAKIQELSELKHDNILSPIEPLYKVNSRTPIGFTMKYVEGVEYLCQIFTKTFRNDKHLSPTDVADLVLDMQKTLQYIHEKGFLVVDYNEMNFLLSKGLKNVFYIDVDAWQTKSFPADSIMASILDRQVKNKQFTEVSDWFSWAVVTFQMYVGIHPFKGRHPDFLPKEWMKRMDQNVSVFDSRAKPLPDTCQDLSVIPKKHLDWYKEVFVNGERSIPPLPDGIMVIAAVDKRIQSKGSFIVKEIVRMRESIRNIFFFNGHRYIRTSKAIYDHKNKEVITFAKSMKSAQIGMCDVFGEYPLVVYLKNLKAEFYDLNNRSIAIIQAEDMMGYNGLIYTINNGRLVENFFEKFKKIIHLTKVVCKISKSCKVYRGVIIQDDFTKIRLAIPFEKGKCINAHVSELDGHRIINARYDKGICIIISERKGEYLKYTICFNKEHSSYDIKQETIADYYPVNFIVLPNKLCLSVSDDKLSLFKNNSGSKDLTDLPFNVSMRLYHDNMQVFFVDNKVLYSITMS